MTYPLKFREHVLSFRDAEGLTLAQTAQRFGVGIATLTRWVKRIEPCKNYRRPWLKIDIVALARDVRQYPDAYLYERAARLGVSRNGVFEALRRMGVSYKKKLKTSSGGRRKTAVLPKDYRDL